MKKIYLTFLICSHSMSSCLWCSNQVKFCTVDCRKREREDCGGGTSVFWDGQETFHNTGRPWPQELCAQHDWRCSAGRSRSACKSCQLLVTTFLTLSLRIARDKARPNFINSKLGFYVDDNAIISVKNSQTKLCQDVFVENIRLSASEEA